MCPPVNVIIFLFVSIFFIQYFCIFSWIIPRYIKKRHIKVGYTNRDLTFFRMVFLTFRHYPFGVFTFKGWVYFQFIGLLVLFSLFFSLFIAIATIIGVFC